MRAVSWVDRTGQDAGDGTFGTGTNRREPEDEQPRRSLERVRVRMLLPLLDPRERVTRRVEGPLPGPLYGTVVVTVGGWLLVAGHRREPDMQDEPGGQKSEARCC